MTFHPLRVVICLEQLTVFSTNITLTTNGKRVNLNPAFDWFPGRRYSVGPWTPVTTLAFSSLRSYGTWLSYLFLFLKDGYARHERIA